MFQRFLILSTLILAVPVWADHPSLTASSQGSGPLVTVSALTLAKGAAAVGLEVQWLSFQSVSDSELAAYDSAVHMADELYQYSLSAQFGVSEHISLGVSLPFVQRLGLRENAHHHHSEGGAEGFNPLELGPHEHAEDGVSALGDSEGVGDLRLRLQWRFWQQENRHLSLLAGLKLPTGKTSEKSVLGNRLETEMQPGSGSTDVSLGLAYTRQWGDWSLDSNILYSWADEGAQDTDLGDAAQANLALSHRQHFASAHDHGDTIHYHQDSQRFMDWMLELNTEWRDQLTIADETEQNSGGTVVFLSPGLRWGFSAKTSLGLSLGIPVLESLRGVQGEPESRVIFSISHSL